MASSTSDTPPPTQLSGDQLNVRVQLTRIIELLRNKEKEDTQRFLGLALLQSALDTSPTLRNDENALQSLWDSLSAKFLDRLLHTGSDPANANAKEMLDIAVSVLHTFAALLPAQLRAAPKLTGRIPGLVAAILRSSDDTVKLILQLLQTLSSSYEGARALIAVDDLSPLTEIAPCHAAVLDVLRFAWLNCTGAPDRSAVSRTIDRTIQSLAVSFTGTDAITLLEFLAALLRQLDPTLLPARPKWLTPVCGRIRALVSNRPSAEARSAYTNAAASLLQAYPSTAPSLLFTDKQNEDRPFAYLLINLLLIDIRSSAPSLLEQLNTPAYAATSRRLASALDVICIFIGHLVRSLEDESIEGLVMLPDNLLKLRKAISDTMSVTMEYLRDRWDASVAGAMGLHPDARVAKTEDWAGSRQTLTWDSMTETASDDALILSAVRTLALWLREDNAHLRKEATGLMDMLTDLYRMSDAEKLDFRSPVLVALEGLMDSYRGREALLRHDGWQLLSKDLARIIANDGPLASRPGEARRGFDIVRVLLQVAEQESSGTEEEWMDLVTSVAAWDIPLDIQSSEVRDFEVAVLQLSCTLLARASQGLRNRFRHSTSAVSGIAKRLEGCIGKDSPSREAIDDVLDTLGGLRNMR